MWRATSRIADRYTPSPDYDLPDTGSPMFVDFGYNNITFPEPQQQLQHYKTSYNMRFGGIRKPRLGNRSNTPHTA
jgi:alpha-glucosidase (family GH31 glycosyl hydrolase)